MAEKLLKLRVYARHHTHEGRTYRVGDEFEGGQRLLDAFGDRLELVAPLKPVVEPAQADPAPQAEAKAPPSAKKG